jgi:hypothetical protein
MKATNAQRCEVAQSKWGLGERDMEEWQVLSKWWAMAGIIHKDKVRIHDYHDLNS